jgi:hypothetical protein
MADYTISKYSDFYQVVVLSFVDSLGVSTPIDHADYNIQCKIRDPFNHPDRPANSLALKSYIPNSVQAFTVTKVVGEPSKVEIELTDTVTGTFTSTEYAADADLPKLNFQLELIVGGDKSQTTPQTVEIVETQAYD